MWTDAGKQVAYLLVTRGEAGIDGIDPARCAPLREAEQRAAAAAVGVDVVEFLEGHHDGVIEHSIALRRDIAGAVRRHRPELVVTLNHQESWPGGGWNSPDHRNVGRAVLDAVADAGNRWIHGDLGLEPWGGVRWVAIAGAHPSTHEVELSDDAFERAVRSLEAHAAYLDGLGGAMADARGFLEGQARRDDGRLATAFHVVAR